MTMRSSGFCKIFGNSFFDRAPVKPTTEVFYNKTVFKNLAIFIGKAPALESLFNKVGGLKFCNFQLQVLQPAFVNGCFYTCERLRLNVS